MSEDTPIPAACVPCSDGEHADDGHETACPCCGQPVNRT